MKKTLYIFLLLFFSFGCKNPVKKIEVNPKTVNMLIDVHIAEAALQNLRGELKDSMANIYYQQIFTIYDIDEKQFQNIIDSLKQDARLMEEVYKKVNEKIKDY